MDRYTPSNNIGSSITVEHIFELFERMKPSVVEFEPLDRYIAEGGEMTSTTMMFTSIEEYKEIPQINTKHGILKIKYSHYIPIGTVCFMNPPKLEDLFKPDFSKLFRR